MSTKRLLALSKILAPLGKKVKNEKRLSKIQKH
jgi:hypothetical protein